MQTYILLPPPLSPALPCELVSPVALLVGTALFSFENLAIHCDPALGTALVAEEAWGDLLLLVVLQLLFLPDSGVGLPSWLRNPMGHHAPLLSMMLRLRFRPLGVDALLPPLFLH